MDAVHFNQQLDARLLSTGLVDKAFYLQLADAYGYGAATSVSWVGAKIRVLATRLARGESLELYAPSQGAPRTCCSVAALQVWTAQHFPGV